MSLIVITGQTATGKTALAVELAKKYNGELINYDSRQVYKYLDIITGKDLPASQIHLYDIITPDKYFSSFDYVEKARPLIEAIQKKGKTPILVGGTYLYLKHLLYDFDVKVPPDFALREVLNVKTVPELQAQLKKLSIDDLESLNNSDRNNPRRLIRKIEILSQAKQKIYEPKAVKITDKNQNKLGVTSYIGISYRNRDDLVTAIKTRVANRIKDGALDEVKGLLEKGYTGAEPGLKTIGYQEMVKYLRGDLTFDQAITEWTNHEIQYAKRQYTFMKKDKNISWRYI
jgi:tRNA dimethylallyltransferase